MSERQRGLGRGLSALLGEQAAEAVMAADEAAQVAAPARPGSTSEFPIELLHPNPDQPRKIFTEAELEELGASIREKGVLQPILVRPSPLTPGEYQIVAGERRWRASYKAGLKTVPVIVRDLDDLEVLEIGIVENVQRADLNPMEEALSYKALMERFGRTQDAVAQVVGKSRSHVANTMRLLALPEAVRDHVLAGRLSAGHARAIATAPDPAALAERVIQDGLSVRQAEALSREAAERPRREPRPGSNPAAKSADTAALESDLADALGLDVVLDDRNGKGELKIRYTTLEQLDDLCRRLMRGGV
ncbi:ParB/RepB/Spo0J family partition protein [Caulobacter sp. 17J65-9]|uniref:ParB/RepB/Spo0J family partition protein n=1 Tax=Caulobacter sp. 17J65-9 TaxID=2709382 RepID=UPI0013CA9B16|nr:ParB/RepB/Spo0J family partition protein [Caulobacter sp. 17J65-9]NEX91522.1 ParB/RepB/Spo0J family partition protein [Caulobacter sp. 17J65-9]